MLPDNIDDLFRQQLDSHATPPPADLWARLQQAQQPAAEEPLDAQFRAGLAGHATPPRREVWERLEDEYLRPRPRRKRPVVAWWQLSAAALLLLGLLAGGLWRGGILGKKGDDVAGIMPEKSGGKNFQADRKSQDFTTDNQVIIPQETLSTAATSEKKQKFPTPQATASIASPSSTPIASTTRPRRAAPAGASSRPQRRQQPDAAAALLAHTGGRKTPASQSPTVAPAALVAGSPNAPALAAAPVSAPEIIEVEVRRGAGAASAPAVVAVAAAEPVSKRRSHLRFGGLLRQAKELAQDKATNFADATGLPDNVMVQARLGGRLLTKNIQL